MLILCQILIPVVSDVTRLPWPADKFPRWQNRAADLFGGWTLDGIVQGAWKDENGVLVTDESRSYTIGIEAERMAEMRAFVSETCREFEQRCIMFKIIGSAELIGP